MNQPQRIHKVVSRESVEDILRSAAEAEGSTPIEEVKNSDAVGECPITHEAEEIVEGNENVDDTGLIVVREATELRALKHTDSAAVDVEGICTIDEVENEDAVGDLDATHEAEEDIEGIVNLEDVSLTSVPNAT